MSIVDDYKKLVPGIKEIEKPQSFFPQPKDKDYSNGYIIRFFVQKTNDKFSTIYEVNEKTYTRFLRNSNYTAVYVKWRLTGSIEPTYNEIGEIKDVGVRESNRRGIKLRLDKIPQLKNYLPNLLQFYRQ